MSEIHVVNIDDDDIERPIYFSSKELADEVSKVLHRAFQGGYRIYANYSGSEPLDHPYYTDMLISGAALFKVTWSYYGNPQPQVMLHDDKLREGTKIGEVYQVDGTLGVALYAKTMREAKEHAMELFQPFADERQKKRNRQNALKDVLVSSSSKITPFT